MSTVGSVWKRTDPPSPAAPAYFTELSVTNDAGAVAGEIGSTHAFGINVTLRVIRRTPPMQVPMRIINQEGIVVLTTSNVDSEMRLMPLSPGVYRYRVVFPANLLVPGSYSVNIVAHVPRTVLFDSSDALAFNIADTGSPAEALGDGRWGVVSPLLRWERLDDHTSSATEAALGSVV